MKKLSAFFLLVIILIGFSSCDKTYEHQNQYYYGMVTVDTGGLTPVFRLDDSTYLSSNFYMPADTFEVGERYFLYYCLADTLNQPVNTHSIFVDFYQKAQIRSFNVLEVDSTDRWANAPIPDFSLAWFSGHYINLMYTTYLGTSLPNTFELIRNKKSERSLPDDTIAEIVLELRHNVYSISTIATRTYYTSLDLSSLKTAYPNVSTFNLLLRWNSASLGSKTRKLTYRPN